MDSKDKKASREGAVVSKDEFAEYEHGANGAMATTNAAMPTRMELPLGKLRPTLPLPLGKLRPTPPLPPQLPRPTPPLPMMRSRVPTPAKAPTKAPPLPKTPRPAVALIGRPFALSAGSGALLGNRTPSGVACRIRTRCCRRASSMRALSPKSESTARRALRKIGSTTTRK